MGSHPSPRILSLAPLALVLAAGCGAPLEGDEAGDDPVAGLSPSAIVESGSCPAPAGTPPEAARALARVNAYRTAMGLSCARLVPEISAAAAAHCAYYTSNRGSCIANPHREVPSCSSFKGERFTDRLRVAGYGGHPAYEAMAYFADSKRAVDAWVDSIWHRLPVVHPSVRDLGYGSVGRCDTMNFGWGERTNVIATFPFAGQANVPTQFDGRRESPAPQAPPKGWPSGYPVTVYAPGLRVTSHGITVDGDGKALPHTFLAPGTPESLGLLMSEYILYTHAPLKAKTRYRVQVRGERDGKPVTLDWTFTTR